MQQSKRFGKLIAVVALGFLYSPVYSHHVPGPTSASVVISIPGTATSVTLSTGAADANFRLTCTELTTTTRNVTCNLPATQTIGGLVHPFRIPAGPVVAGTLQFEITRTVPGTPAKGAEFVALCNAVSGGPCDNTIQYKFVNSTIKKVGGSGTTAQQVQLDFGFTMGLLPNQSLNSGTIESPGVGRTHGFTSSGMNVQASGLTAFGNTSFAAASFTYVLSNAQCGTTNALSPEPFSIAGCTKTLPIPCKTGIGGVTCSASGGSYTVNSTTLTSHNAIAVGGAITLLDNTQRLCTDLAMFGAGKTCRAIERGNATVRYGLTRINDKVNISASGEGSSGLVQDVVTAAAAENGKCGLHESGGGVNVNPNAGGQFQVRMFGSAEINTNTTHPTTTFLSLPGGKKIQANDIRYNFNFEDPETGVRDEFFDVWVVYNSSELQPDVTCEAMAGQTITLVQEAVADVTVPYQTVVAGEQRGPTPDTQTFPPLISTQPAVVKCQIQAIVGPCN